MTFSMIIFLISMFTVGLFMGVAIEYFIDVGLMREMQNENRTLRMKLAEARKTRKVEHVQTLEIIDNRTSNPDNLFAPF